VSKARGSCKAVDALTGLRCRLPAHSEQLPHRHERGAFFTVAAEGQKNFTVRDRLDAAATARNFEGAVHER
jgi:hypothetical protein